MRLAVAGAATIAMIGSSAFAGATTVREPAWGLPHIYAATDLELARENGREIAKDRMGQLILLARAGRGSLAQAFGLLDPSFVQSDKETRLAGYTSSELNRMFNRLPPTSRDFVLEYCKGVNDTLDDIYAGIIDTPIEISVLRNGLFGLSADLFGNASNLSDQVDPYYEAPGGADPEHPHGGFQFTPEMAMAIAVLQVRNFGLNTFEEEKRLAELVKLQDLHGGDGLDIWRDYNFLSDPLAPVSVPDPTTPGYGGPLADNQAEHDAIVAADETSRWPDYDWDASAAGIKDKAAQREELLKRWSAWPKLGSYGWAIASNRSATGHPWLGGFPQTGIQTPSLMHYVENRSGEGIAGNGMEFVGGAYVLIGHTDSVAYTTTTAQLRIIDTFFETVVNENADAVRYSDEGTAAPLNKRAEVIKTPDGDVNATFWRSHERGGNGGTRPILDFVGSAEGTAESGSTTTLVDNQGTFTGSFVGGYVLITDGAGAGQIRQISGVPAATTLSVGSAFTTAPASGSVYVAVSSGGDIIAVSNDSGAWLEESQTANAFALFQKAHNAMDIRAAVRLIPSTHNFFASDNQAFNGTGTSGGYGNIAYFSSGYSRKRQGSEEKLLPLDGSAPNPLIVAEGVLTAATANTATSTGAFGGDYSPDAINHRYNDPTDQGSEYIISIMSGTGGKQTRRIASNDADTVTVEADWGVTPAPGDRFEVYEIVGMPEAVNPAEGYLANWNNKAATADDGDGFGREHRVAFILERLAADSSWTRDDQHQLNKDVAGLDGRGVLGRHLIPRLREAVDAVGDGGNPLVDVTLTALETNNTASQYGRYFVDPVTADSTAGEVIFLNTLINDLAAQIYGDEYAGALGVPTGTRAQNLVIHAIDAAAGTPVGAYDQQYDDYFNGADWKTVVRDRFSALADGIGYWGVRGLSTYNHPLAALSDQLSFDPTPLGNRGTWEQIVEAGPTVNGEFMFPLGQSGSIQGSLSGFDLTVRRVDPNCTSIQPIWRDWRFLPMLHVSQDLAGAGADADGDGVFDGFERWYFGDTSRDAKENSDGDTSMLATEFARGSDPTDSDTDDDGLLDGLDGLDQDRLGSAFSKFKGSFKLPATSGKDMLKINGKFGTGGLVFDEAADTMRVQVENENGDSFFDVTVPAGTLTADPSGLKFSFKDKDGVIGAIGQLQIKLGATPEKDASFKLATVKTDLTPPVALSTNDLRVTVTIHNTAADTNRKILDERSWEVAGRALKSGKYALVPVYN